MKSEDIMAGTSGVALGAQVAHIVDKARRKERLTALDMIGTGLAVASLVLSVCMRQRPRQGATVSAA